MDTVLNVLPVIALASLLSVFLVLLPLAIIFNFRTGLRYRSALAGKIHARRLGKMLSALGIDIDEYLASERTVDIHQHIRRCGECTNVGRCDEGLASGSIKADSIQYCNNEQSLREIVNKSGKPD